MTPVPDFEESKSQRAWRRWAAIRYTAVTSYHWNRSLRLTEKARIHGERFEAADTKAHIAFPDLDDDDA
jgi:hypothetical protein